MMRKRRIARKLVKRRKTVRQDRGNEEKQKVKEIETQT